MSDGCRAKAGMCVAVAEREKIAACLLLRSSEMDVPVCVQAKENGLGMVPRPCLVGPE